MGGGQGCWGFQMYRGVGERLPTLTLGKKKPKHQSSQPRCQYLKLFPAQRISEWMKLTSCRAGGWRNLGLGPVPG